MTALSALVTRAVAEINDATNNTFSASITGTNFSELQEYAVDGIKDYSNWVFREIFDQSIITSANKRSYVVSALSPAPFILKRVEYVYTSTNTYEIPDVDLWNGSMYLYDHDKPLFTQANYYFNLFYYAQHDTPSAGSAALTIPSSDEELIVTYIKHKAMSKQALDQRGVSQDTANEFLALATEFERRYKEGLKRATTTFTRTKG